MSAAARSWMPSAVSCAIGLAFLLAAFFGSYRPEVCAIVGGLLLLQPATEWAIARRLTDFTIRATIQADSFDTVWSRVNDTLREHGGKLRALAADVTQLQADVGPLKEAAQRVALQPRPSAAKP